jgi:hypothetical protein
MNELRLEVFFANALQIATSPTTVGKRTITIYHSGIKVTAEGDHVMYTLAIGFQVKMQVAYFDSAGNPATVDGNVLWTSSDDDLASVTPDPDDSTIVTVASLSQLGQVQITATADADLGAGKRQLITTADIEIVAGEAVTGTISPVGEATPIP